MPPLPGRLPHQCRTRGAAPVFLWQTARPTLHRIPEPRCTVKESWVLARLPLPRVSQLQCVCPRCTGTCTSPSSLLFSEFKKKRKKKNPNTTKKTDKRRTKPRDAPKTTWQETSCRWGQAESAETSLGGKSRGLGHLRFARGEAGRLEKYIYCTHLYEAPCGGGRCGRGHGSWAHILLGPASLQAHWLGQHRDPAAGCRLLREGS